MGRKEELNREIGIEKRRGVKKGINERAAVTVLCRIYKVCTSNCLIDQRIDRFDTIGIDVAG